MSIAICHYILAADSSVRRIHASGCCYWGFEASVRERGVDRPGGQVLSAAALLPISGERKGTMQFICIVSGRRRRGIPLLVVKQRI